MFQKSRGMLFLRSRNAAGTPLLPSAAPQARILNESGEAVMTVSLPLFDQERITAYFHTRVNLTGDFTAQRYTVLYTWLISTTLMASMEEFEIMPGGTTKGAGIAMHYFRQESADYVLLQNDAGVLNKLRGPEVRNAR